MTTRMKSFGLAILVGLGMLLGWGWLSNNIFIGILVGGMSFASFLFGSAATIYFSNQVPEK